MKTYNIFTNEEDSLPEGKADFIIAASVSRTCEIDGITQAGIPGMISSTPTLDAEFLVHEKVFSIGEMPETPGGVPTPAIITRAVHNLVPFSAIEIFDLGLETIPQNCIVHNFDIPISGSIATGANIDAKAVFEKGMKAGREYELKGNYLILSECVPSGTTTATTTALALGYDCRDDFSSSFANVPSSIKSETIDKALSLITDNMSRFEKLSLVSDNMLIFNAGFLMEASRRFHVVLAGGTQMAACLLVADALREDVLMRVKHENITLATTSWVANDKNSDIAHILSLLSFKPNAVHTSFSFADTGIPVLKKYDNGEVKEGVGAGAALGYACANKVNNAKLLEAIERILYSM